MFTVDLGLFRYLAEVRLLFGWWAGSCGFEQLAGELDLPFDAWLLVMDVAVVKV